MRLSIRFKFTLIFVGIIIGVIVAISMAYHYLLESYVVGQKRSRLMQIKAVVEDYVNSGLLVESRDELERECRIANVLAMVVDSAQEGWDHILYASDLLNDPFAYMRMDEYTQSGKPSAITVLDEGDGYVLYKATDRSMGTVMECAGSISGCYNYILSTPLESISQTVRSTNRFSQYVGVIAALVGGIIVFFVTGTLTKPIKQLSVISEQMANQNFDVRYTGKSGDEIGQLGQSMNHMSENLKTVIGELRRANEKLEEDIREKEEIDRRRMEFISNVSHELKTPIALIRGYSEGLKEGVSDDPESREYYCDVIIDEADKMNTIVRRLMNLGEIESGAMKLERMEFDLREMLEGTCERARMLVSGMDVEVTLDAPPQLSVFADQFMVEEILQNYISNACHHVIEPGKIEVRACSIARREAGARSARVEVFNTGSHIPDEDLERIWDKFFKVDRSHSRKYGGSGIGLSIVKAIVDAHGGLCGAENRENGVSFWFEL